MKHLKLLSAICVTGALLAPVASQAGTCTPLGYASDCNVLFTIGAGNTIAGAIIDPTPYDGIEDSYVGVINNGTSTIASLTLTGYNIFGFDFDGQNNYTGISYDSTGYAGPNTSFSIVDSDNGTVNFTGGLKAGQMAWFTLEEDPSAISLTNVTVTTAVPEPETYAMLLAGLGLMGAVVRRRKA